MKTMAIAFTNFGPYHLARLRALARALAAGGDRLIAYEVADSEATYPWSVPRAEEPFVWTTLFPGRVLEEIPAPACKSAIVAALRRDSPDAVGVVGYARPESSAMSEWACRNDVPAVLMSETQEMDHPRVWWKEAVKRRRVRRFSAGFVGGPRHRDYLATLGLPPERVTLGYNAVDSQWFAANADQHRRGPGARRGLPRRPYFIAVSRFVPEKNLERLIHAYSLYRINCAHEPAWDLVLCGGGPGEKEVRDAAAASGWEPSIHFPGFLQADELTRWHAFASAFVHPSLMEPWGLVVNEAAACGLPLLVSSRAGCVETFVPMIGPATGRRLDGHDAEGMAAAMDWISCLPAGERTAIGRNARAIANQWGPGRFAEGAIEAFRIAEAHRHRQGKRQVHDMAIH